jgi:hypothetical protein
MNPEYAVAVGSYIKQGAHYSLLVSHPSSAQGKVSLSDFVKNLKSLSPAYSAELLKSRPTDAGGKDCGVSVSRCAIL